MLNSLSAITLSETGESALKVAGGRPLSEFSADLIDVDDILIHKAEDALQILQEYRPQFQHDHPVGAAPSPYVRDLIDYLTKTASIFDILASVFGKCKVAESWEDNYRRIKLSEAYAKAFRLIADEYATNYGKASKNDEKGQGKGDPETSFDNYILSGDKDTVKAKLHQLIDGKKGVGLATVVTAAQESGLIDKCVGYAILQSEFDIKGSKQAYSQAVIKIGFEGHRAPEYEGRITQMKDKLKA